MLLKIQTKLFRAKYIFFFLLVSIMVSCSEDDEEQIDPNIEASTFLDNAEGWQIIGDAQGGFVAVSYSPDGGVTDGYIYAEDDVTGGVWYFAAPDSYLGEQSDYYNATLSYNLFQNSAQADQFEAKDIVFKNGEVQIYHQILTYPGENWTEYEVTISADSNWMKGETGDINNGSSVLATEEDIKAVLSNLTAFYIRGEFEDGSDEGGLDNVQIIRN